MYELTRRWVKAEHSVTVVTAPYEKSDIKADGFISIQYVEGIRLIIINAADSNRNGILKRVLMALLFSVVSCWYALTQKYDVAICSSGPITICFPGLIASWIRRKKMIFEVRDLWPAGGIEMGKIKGKLPVNLALWFERICYNTADLIITASPDQRKHIASRFPALKIEVISNASDREIFGTKTTKSLPEWTESKVIFTHIGSLGYIHNCELLVRAAHLIQQMNEHKICIIFIGEGAERDKLEKLADSLELTNVKFLGLLPKQELPAWVQQSCATLFSTLNNPIQDSSSPNKVFDSFAASTPVIQTTSGWLKQLITEHKCGINVPPDAAEDLAFAMISLSKDSELRNEMGVNAFRVASSIYDRDMLAMRYLEYITETYGT